MATTDRSVPHLIAFSLNGEYLAYLGADGRLKLWETSTGTLKQEYVPASHLSATCTCLAWSTKPSSEPSLKKRRRTSILHNAPDTFSLIAMGTLVGKILVYSVTKGDLETELSGGHSDAVSGICWNVEENEMFSCSYDSNIVRWNFSKGNVKSKWKADRGSIHCIALLSDKQTLLSSGRTIKWWDIERQEVLKKFHGHTSHVFQLKLICFPSEPVQGGYFISAASGDRLLSAWDLNSSSKSALVSFSLSEEPVGFDVTTPSSRDQKLLLAAVTKNGAMHVFEHQLNGKSRKPIEPKVTVQIATEGGKTPKPVPVLSCRVCDDYDHSVEIAYGSFLKITCEKLPYTSLESNTCLIRQLTSTRDSFREKKIRTPDMPSSARVVAPGCMVPTQPILDTSQGAVSKRKLDTTTEQMGDRLKGLSLSVASNTTVQPSSDNVLHLLMQWLHSRDESLLNPLFHSVKTDIIKITVNRLPVETIKPLLEELCQRLQLNQTQDSKLLVWIRILIQSQSSYFTTCSDVQSILNPLYQMIDARLGLFQRMVQLKGRMELIMSELEEKSSESSHSRMPVLTYQDDSSDPDEVNSFVEDILHSHSESEVDNWDYSEAESEEEMREGVNLAGGDEEEGDSE